MKASISEWFVLYVSVLQSRNDFGEMLKLREGEDLK